MNQRDLTIQRKMVWRKYHVPGMGNYTTRPINAIFLSPANSLEHEMEKCRQCYEQLKARTKFITESVCNKTGLRRDIVVLDTGEIIEVETCPKRASRFKDDPMTDDITVVKLWEMKG